jgi:hypothetical protein
MTRPIAFPRLFALTRDEGEPNQVIGYGLVLPDGSAYAVSWPNEQGATTYSSSTPEECAALRGADLLWIDDEP